MEDSAPDLLVTWRKWSDERRAARLATVWQPQPLAVPVNGVVARCRLARETAVRRLGSSSGGEYHEVSSMLETDFSAVCAPDQCAPRTYDVLVVDPPWADEGGVFVVDDLRRIPFKALVPNGVSCVWVHGAIFAATVQCMCDLGFRLIDSFCWVLHDQHHSEVVQRVVPGSDLRESHVTLLVFQDGIEREGTVPLTPQTVDVTIEDQMWRRSRVDLMSSYVRMKPDCAYDAVRLMAAASPWTRLLELWGPPGEPRFGWTVFVER